MVFVAYLLIGEKHENNTCLYVSTHTGGDASWCLLSLFCLASNQYCQVYRNLCFYIIIFWRGYRKTGCSAYFGHFPIYNQNLLIFFCVFLSKHLKKYRLTLCQADRWQHCYGELDLKSPRFFEHCDSGFIYVSIYLGQFTSTNVMGNSVDYS